MILRLEILFSDGSKKIIVSDDTWKTSPSPITFQVFTEVKITMPGLNRMAGINPDLLINPGKRLCL